MYILPIIGIIGEPEKGKENILHFRFTDLLMHLNAAKEEPHIHLVVGSDGGDVGEGKKMKAALIDSGKTFSSSNSGNVASMAVDLFLIPKEKARRNFDPTKGLFLIHNPWAAIEGDADLMSEASKYMKGLEKEFSKEYAAITGTDENVLIGFMSEDKPLTPEQVDTLGFATVTKQVFKAVAKFNINKNKMEVKEIKELNDKMSIMDLAIKKLTTLFEKKSDPKALMIQDVNGAELDFGEAIETPEQIVVGVSATVAGVPAEGDYTLEDGTVYTFAAGKLDKIVLPESDVEALKTENADLKTQIATLTKGNEDSQAKLTKENADFKLEAAKQLKEVSEELVKIKALATNFKPKGNLSEEELKREKEGKFSYKKKEKK